jgi:hypothetical protein
MKKIDPGDDETGEPMRLCKELKDPTPISCRSPQRARDVAEALLKSAVGSMRKPLKDAIEWIGKEYHPEWLFGRALAQGIGLDHGQLARTLGQVWGEGLQRW